MENCYILAVWEHGNQKTDTSIYYSIILYLSANIEKITGFKADIRWYKTVFLWDMSKA